MPQALNLFSKRGPDQPRCVKLPYLGQTSIAYTAGREDFLFNGEQLRRGEFSSFDDVNAYDCAWAHERRDMARAIQGNAGR